MSDILAALLFALWVAAQFLAVVFVRQFDKCDRQNKPLATNVEAPAPDRDAKIARGLMI
jgi:hypothetical protein